MSREQTNQEHVLQQQDVKLTKTQKDALLDIAQPKHNHFGYWWRQKSMAALEKHGLVRRGGGTHSHPGWWITEKGHMFVQELARERA